MLLLLFGGAFAHATTVRDHSDPGPYEQQRGEAEKRRKRSKAALDRAVALAAGDIRPVREIEEVRHPPASPDFVPIPLSWPALAEHAAGEFMAPAQPQSAFETALQVATAARRREEEDTELLLMSL